MTRSDRFPLSRGSIYHICCGICHVNSGRQSHDVRCIKTRRQSCSVARPSGRRRRRAFFFWVLPTGACGQARIARPRVYGGARRGRGRGQAPLLCRFVRDKRQFEGRASAHGCPPSRARRRRRPSAIARGRSGLWGRFTRALLCLCARWLLAASSPGVRDSPPVPNATCTVRARKSTGRPGLLDLDRRRSPAPSFPNGPLVYHAAIQQGPQAKGSSHPGNPHGLMCRESCGHRSYLPGRCMSA